MALGRFGTALGAIAMATNLSAANAETVAIGNQETGEVGIFTDCTGLTPLKCTNEHVLAGESITESMGIIPNACTTIIAGTSGAPIIKTICKRGDNSGQ